MDIEANIREIKEILVQGRSDPHTLGVFVLVRLFDLVEALFAWLSRGGFPPAAWLHQFIPSKETGYRVEGFAPDKVALCDPRGDDIFHAVWQDRERTDAGEVQISAFRARTELAERVVALLNQRDPLLTPELPVNKRCAPDCDGWLFEAGDPQSYVMRCDDCGRFANDKDAAEFAAAKTGRRLRYVLEEDANDLPVNPPERSPF